MLNVYDDNRLKAPPERERSRCAFGAQVNLLLNKPLLLPANFPEDARRRAPTLLHVGRRISVIQGRRVGEWHGQHRSEVPNVP